MTTTPPLRSRARTPSTPLHGARYAPTPVRRSARFSARRIGRTPSPVHTETHFHYKKSFRPTKGVSTAITFSPPSSTPASPEKKVLKKAKSPGKSKKQKMEGVESAQTKNPAVDEDSMGTLFNNMLPTPAKTPRKKALIPGAGAAGRKLFQVHADTNEFMPSPRKKKSNRNIGLSLDTFDEEQDEIEIYTDSKERVPELDENEDNPFYVKPGTESVVAIKEGSKRRKVSGEFSAIRGMEEEFRREDGMVYVFRGKKMFRKFRDEEPDSSDQLDLPSFSNSFPTSVDTIASSGRWLRSSIKPRLLFPTEAQRLARLPPPSPGRLADEEATTDIDETNMHHGNGGQDTDMTEEENMITPVKQSFEDAMAPTSPPSTGRGRATRSSKKATTHTMDGEMPATEPEAILKVTRAGKGADSSFDEWPRSKSVTSTSRGKGRKREADVLDRGEGGKRVRG